MKDVVLQTVLEWALAFLVPAAIGGVSALWLQALRWFRANVAQKDQAYIESVVSGGVRAVEQLWTNPGVQEVFQSKKSEAFNYIDGRLRKAGYRSISAEHIYSMIEAEVHNLKVYGGEIKSSPAKAAEVVSAPAPAALPAPPAPRKRRSPNTGKSA